jgi:hypothetical protein
MLAVALGLRFYRSKVSEKLLKKYEKLDVGAATVKDMRTGEQRQVLLDKLATEICNS